MKRAGLLSSVAMAAVSTACAAESPDPDAQVAMNPFEPLLVFDATDPTNFRRSRAEADIATPHGTGDAFAASCGTLDCHGHEGRNLRVFSRLGMRPLPPVGSGLEPNVVGGADTTAEEYNATIESIIALEPLVLDAVIDAGGQAPERLQFIRKARGTENHAGGTLMIPGDALDQCLTSWVSIKADRAACSAAYVAAQAPEPPPEQ